MSGLLRAVELVLPGAAIGLVVGAMVGGLAAMGGLPADAIAINAVALGLPLAAAGVGYDVLLAQYRFRLGGIAPAALYWLAAFPAARLLHQTVVSLVTAGSITYQDGLLRFLVWQAIISLGFAIGFMWLHEHTAPLWWMRIRGHNPIADSYVRAYTQQAAQTEERKARQSAARRQRRDAGAGTTAGRQRSTPGGS